jgi:WD40 repeat protein
MSLYSDSNQEYQVGGSLPIDAPSYVRRQADEQFYHALRSREFCYVLNSRQMGKSSLRVQTVQRLQKYGVACACIDMTAIGTAGITPEQWYAGVIDSLVNSLMLYDRFELEAWWEQEKLLSPVQRFSKFLGKVLLQLVESPIVIVIDEIDSILSLEFKVDDFFAVIRDSYNHRADQPMYRRLTVALIGVATPTDLIQDRQRTPFNIGQPIELLGFQFHEASALVPGLAGISEDPKSVLKIVLDWTGGQPFLTQKVCRFLARSQQWIALGQESEAVATIVKTQILNNWEAQDTPEHLKTIRDRLLHSETEAGRLLGLYQSIVQEGSIAAQDSPEQLLLRLTGLVVNRSGELQVYNAIYQQVFDQSWLAASLAQLRPYGSEIAAWLATGGKDESRLLRGQALLDAIDWTRGKQLDDEDYRFLGASQLLKTQEVMGKLAAEAEANFILNTARQQAEQDLEQARRTLKIVNIRNIVSGVTAIIAFVTTAIVVPNALDQRNLIRQATALEKSGNSALKRSQLDIVGGLVEAMETGEEAKELLQKKGATGFVASPTYVLHTILSTLENRSIQPWKHQTLLAQSDRITDAQFSPDGKSVVTISDDRTAKVWDIQSGREITTLRGHQDVLTAVQFNPAGDRIITTSADKTARLWNAKSGQEIMKFVGHQGKIQTVRVSRDGRQMITASIDRTARLWDIQSGREITKFVGHQDEVNLALFSPDRRTILTVSPDQTARIWDIQSGREIRQLIGHKGNISSAQFSPDGTQIVTASHDRTVRIWNAQSGREVIRFRGHKGHVNMAQFSPDGTRIVSASDDNTARVWGIKSRREFLRLTTHQFPVRSAMFSPNNLHIVTASEDNTARVWDARKGYEISILSGHEKTVNTAKFSLDGRQIITVSNDQTAKIWDHRNPKDLLKFIGHRASIDTLDVSPNGQQIATASDDQTVRIWDIKTQSEIMKLTGPRSKIWSVAFSPNGQQVVTASDDRIVRVWDLASGKILVQLIGHTGITTSARFSPDGQRIVTASADKTARVWDAKSGKELFQLIGHDDWVTEVSFNPKGDRIITASGDRSLRLWDARSGQELRKFIGHDDMIEFVSFSPNGQRLVSASWDRTARIWDINSGQELTKLVGHEGWLFSATFSTDGQRIVTASGDKTARVWDVESGQELSKLLGHRSLVKAARFHPDGQQVITTSADKTARIWRLESLDELMVRGCDWLHNYLVITPRSLEKLPTCQTK